MIIPRKWYSCYSKLTYKSKQILAYLLKVERFNHNRSRNWDLRQNHELSKSLWVIDAMNLTTSYALYWHDEDGAQWKLLWDRINQKNCKLVQRAVKSHHRDCGIENTRGCRKDCEIQLTIFLFVYHKTNAAYTWQFRMSRNIYQHNIILS